jgi:pimeloyl-ACP methyl ester carboxylesterase
MKAINMNHDPSPRPGNTTPDLPAPRAVSFTVPGGDYAEIPLVVDVLVPPPARPAVGIALGFHGQGSDYHTDFADCFPALAGLGWHTVGPTSSRGSRFPGGNFGAWLRSAMGRKGFYAELREVERAAEAGLRHLDGAGVPLGRLPLVWIGCSLGAALVLEALRRNASGLPRPAGVVLLAPSLLLGAEDYAEVPLIGPNHAEPGKLLAMIRDWVEIGMPVRVLWGDRDPIVPWDKVARIRDAGAAVTILPDAGHTFGRIPLPGDELNHRPALTDFLVRTLAEIQSGWAAPAAAPPLPLAAPIAPIPPAPPFKP